MDVALAAIRPLLPSYPQLRSFAATGWPPACWSAIANTGRASPQCPAGASAIAEAERQRDRIETRAGVDIAVFVTERYFGFVDGLLREVRTHASRVDARQMTDHIDAVLVHRLLGLPIFALVMYAIFWLTFKVGEAAHGLDRIGRALPVALPRRALAGWLDLAVALAARRWRGGRAWAA